MAHCSSIPICCRGLFFSSLRGVGPYGPEAEAHPPAAESLLAQLRVGECAPSLFPPPLRFSGPRAPPPTAAQVNTGLPPVTSEETPATALGQLTEYNAEI